MMAAKASVMYIGGTYDVHARNCQVFLQRLVLRIRAPIEITEVFDGMNRGVNNLDLPMDEAPTVLQRRCKEWKQWRKAHGPPAYRFGKQPRPESFPNDVLVRVRTACMVLTLSAIVLYVLNMHLCLSIKLGFLGWICSYTELGSVFSPPDVGKYVEGIWKENKGSREYLLEQAMDGMIAMDITELQKREVFIARFDEIKVLPLRWE